MKAEDQHVNQMISQWKLKLSFGTKITTRLKLHMDPKLQLQRKRLTYISYKDS